MIVKEKDSREKEIQELETISKLPDIPDEIKAKAKKEQRSLLGGMQGENNAAYFIDFYYRDNPNWAIIHDLRIEYNGFTAQIDHLMIGRALEFYVLESKNFSHGIKITERGEFLAWYNKGYRAIESPIEQNKRHIVVLKKLLEGEKLLPKRFGMTLQPTFRPYVLISPKMRVIRPSADKFNTDEVIKMDEFAKRVKADGDDMNPLEAVGFVAKMISVSALEDLARSLVKYHKPVEIDYYEKYGISRVQPERKKDAETSQKRTRSKYFCAKCGKPISKKVAIYCFQHKERFGGKAYCFDCQKTM